MDDKRFDDIAREIGTTRRGALGMITGGLGLLVAAMPDWANAKKRKRKNKKRKKKAKVRCVPVGDVCPSTERDCCGQQCCLDFGQPEGGERYCAFPSVTCCTAEQGGGECPAELPVCCPDGYACAKTLEGCDFDALHDGAGRVARLGRRG
jgi:hypothetical protein